MHSVTFNDVMTTIYCDASDNIRKIFSTLTFAGKSFTVTLLSCVIVPLIRKYIYFVSSILIRFVHPARNSFYASSNRIRSGYPARNSFYAISAATRSSSSSIRLYRGSLIVRIARTVFGCPGPNT